jgi:predicted DNA-binding transcriptional regulator YafY
VSPAARALLALEVIQGAPGITADRLAGRLGVSERAVRRYVGILRDAGIPIDSVRGPYGGYRVGRGLRLPPLIFSSAEALGLVMAVLDGHHAAGDATDPVGSALGKLIRALPEPVARQAEAVRQVAEAAPDRGAVRPDLTVTAHLVQACAEHRAVRIAYRSEAGSEWEVEAEPWAVVVRHGRWYLLCRDLRVDAVRAYRVDRVGEVALTDGSFRPPADLDPVSALEDHLAVGWEHEAVVEVDAPVEEVAKCVPPTLGRLEVATSGRTRLVGSTSNPYWYAEQLAALPAPFRVVGGPELRATVKQLAARLAAAAE